MGQSAEEPCTSFQESAPCGVTQGVFSSSSYYSTFGAPGRLTKTYFSEVCSKRTFCLVYTTILDSQEGATLFAETF
jgi:hypothetical protein